MNDANIFKYIKGEMSLDEKKQFLDWIDAATENKEYYQEIRNLWDISLLTADNEPMDHSAAFDQFRSKLYAGSQEREIGQRKRYRMVLDFMKAAAIVIVTLCSTWYMLDRQPSKSDIAYHRIEVPTGQRVKLTLPEGSEVWLSAGTTFSYPEKFVGADRNVILNGEAQFNVSHSDTYPFVVQTATHSVKVLGTNFKVYAYDESSKFETTLFQGSVQLQRAGENDQNIILESGQQAVFDKDLTSTVINSNVDTLDKEEWEAGYYLFNKTPFKDMAERLSRYYQKKIVIENPAIWDYECTGKFRYDESLEYILNVVKISKPFQYRITKNEVIIY